MKRNVLKIATIAIFSCSGSRTEQRGCLSDGLGSQIKREAANEGFSQRSIGRGLHRARRAFYESRRLARTHGLIAEFVRVTNTPSNPVPMQVADDLTKNPFSQYICLPRAHRAVALPKAPAGHRLTTTSGRTRQIEKRALPRTRTELHAYSAASRLKRQCNYHSDRGDFQ